MLLLDGAIATMLGPSLHPETLNIDTPGLVSRLHDSYLQAGSDIIRTNTFSCHPAINGEAMTSRQVERATILARQATDRHRHRNGKRCDIAGCMSLTTLRPGRDISFEKYSQGFAEMSSIMADNGASLTLLETIYDFEAAKAATEGILKGSDHLKIMLSATPPRFQNREDCTRFANQTAEIYQLAPERIFSLGFNCGFGVDAMTEVAGELSLLSDRQWRVSVMPSAGLPDKDKKYPDSQDYIAMRIRTLCQRSHIDILGGCCGTTPELIALLRKMIDSKESD